MPHKDITAQSCRASFANLISSRYFRLQLAMPDGSRSLKHMEVMECYCTSSAKLLNRLNITAHSNDGDYLILRQRTGEEKEQLKNNNFTVILNIISAPKFYF